MGSLFETCMLICFGLSWPASVLKSYHAKTAEGKSLAFLLIICTGYIFGILGKIYTNNLNYVLALYFLNLLIVSMDVVLYFRNRSYDLKKERAGRPAHAHA